MGKTEAGEKEEQPEKPGMPLKAAVAEAGKRAIALIKTGLKDKPEVQEFAGMPFILKEWPTDFKKILGPYRKFVEKCGEFVVVQGDLPNKFTIQVKGEEASPAAVTGAVAHWEASLAKAWQIYLHRTARDKRRPAEFVEGAKKIAVIPGPAEVEALTKEVKKEKKKKKEAAAKPVASEEEETKEEEPPGGWDEDEEVDAESGEEDDDRRQLRRRARKLNANRKKRCNGLQRKRPRIRKLRNVPIEKDTRKTKRKRKRRRQVRTV